MLVMDGYKLQKKNGVCVNINAKQMWLVHIARSPPISGYVVTKHECHEATFSVPNT